MLSCSCLQYYHHGSCFENIRVWLNIYHQRISVFSVDLLVWCAPPCVQKVVYTYVSLLFPSGTSSLIVVMSKWQLENYDEREEENARRLAQKRKRRQWAKTHPLHHEVRTEIDEYKREEQWLAKQKKQMAVLRNDRPPSPPSLLQCTLCHPFHTAHTLLYMVGYKLDFILYLQVIWQIKDRQSNIISHQPLIQFVCGWAVIIIHVQQIYNTKAIKSHGLKGNNDNWGSRPKLEQTLMGNNKSTLPCLCNSCVNNQTL